MSEHIRDIHVTKLIPDYVLELLSTGDKERVTDHISACKECKAMLQQERQIAQLVHSTLFTATHPDGRRLRQLRPDIPRSGVSFYGSLTWQKSFAVALLLLLVIAGTFALGRDVRPSIWPNASSATYTSVAATDTATITATATLTTNLTRSQAESLPNMVEPYAVPQPEMTPVP